MAVKERVCPTCHTTHGDCLTHEGVPRRPHVRRLIVEAIVLLVSSLVRWIPGTERDLLATTLLQTHDPVPTRKTTQEGRNELAGSDDPNWDEISARLLATDALVARLVTNFRDPRLYFNLDDLGDHAKRLREKVRCVYGLICTTSQLQGLDLRRGDDFDTVRDKVDIRRAEIVNAELATARREPLPDTPRWIVEYRDHGGFLATTPDSRTEGPFRFWGFASTHQCAAYTIAGYFSDQSPSVTFDPPIPLTPRPLAVFDADRSDISPEGPSVIDLLDMRGPVYDEHIAACRQVQELLSGQNLDQYLVERSAWLNATDPQLAEDDGIDFSKSSANHDCQGSVWTVQWVASPLIVAAGHQSWGDFGSHRPNVPGNIADALARATDFEEFTRELFTPQINLVRIPAWAGPIYTLGVNGAHRIHTARMLALPWLAASVQYSVPRPSMDLLDILTSDPDPPRGSRDQRRQERITLIEGLIHRGVIHGELINRRTDQWPTLRYQWLPAPWLLRDAQYATMVNAIYESRYPGALDRLGIPKVVGTEPEKWVTWLTE